MSLRRALGALLGVVVLAGPATAQVHYHDDGRPWTQRAGGGPDATVPGWFYRLGLTGLHVRLLADAPTHLRVEHVAAGSPADGELQVGDVLTGVDGLPFATPHRNGYGPLAFGGDGPCQDVATALERCVSGPVPTGALRLERRRGDTRANVTLRIPTRYGAFAPTWPVDCRASARIRVELLDWLLAQQQSDGSFGGPVQDLFAPLALLARDSERDRAAVAKNAHFHARTTRAAGDERGLVNWYYTTAGIVLAEYHLASGAPWVLPELAEVRTFLLRSQYTDPTQIVRGTHALPTATRTALGGWGHNPGHEGYGPIQMLTGMATLALARMRACGLDVDEARHRLAYDFLARGTGTNGYVWYADEVADDAGWADLGRTGAAASAWRHSPFADSGHDGLAARATACLREHPQSFPDTHGSPPLGMGFAALAAAADPAALRALLDANRWWFTLAHCGDGTFHYQPNRDNAGYGEDARLVITSVVAFVLSLPDSALRCAPAARRGK